jgi:uncharacterized YccA/Bax inhibitor family protein
MAFANPALTTDAFAGQWGYSEAKANVMTIQGTVIKSFGLLAITLLTAGWSWGQMSQGALNGPWLFGSAIGGTIVAFITIFKREWSPVTAPIYAALEGVFLGAFSNIIEQRYGVPGSQFGGLAYKAVSLTFGTLFLMLFLYVTRIIRVTGRLVGGIVAATGAVCLLYFVAMILSFFHIQVPFIWGGGVLGIGFSLFVVGLAAFNLLLDFDVIEQGAAMGAPRYMEWYGAFGLMVTLVWLYIEILRLLAKLSRRND